jgi:hypothetical protein
LHFKHGQDTTGEDEFTLTPVARTLVRDLEHLTLSE